VPTRLIRAELSENAGILEAAVAGKAREIAIAREVGDSVLYHSLSRLKDDRKKNADAMMRSNSAKSTMLSRQSSRGSRTPALPTLGRTQP
jgi:hypothetical protein